MAFIHLPNRWRRPPPIGSYLIDRNHQLARGLRVFFDFRGGTWNVNQVTGLRSGSIAGSGGSVVFGADKMHLTASQDPDFYLDMSLGGFDANGQSITIISGSTRLAGSVQWALLRRNIVNWTGFYRGSNNTFTSTNNNSFDGSLSLSDINPTPSGVFYVAMSFAGANTLRGANGGAGPVVTDTSAAAPTGGPLTDLTVGMSLRADISGPDNPSTSFQEYWGIYDVAHNDAALIELTRNPWQICRPYQRRIYVDVAAGAITGSATLTEDADVATASATVIVTGTSALIEADDSLSSASQVAVSALAALFEDDDVLTASATHDREATASITEDADSLSASATLALTAAFEVTEADDVLSAAAQVAVTADAALVEDGDVLTAQGVAGVAASAALLEQDDVLSAAGTVEFVTVTATASIIEDADIVVSDGVAVVAASLGITEQDDTLQALAAGEAVGTAAMTEDDDRLTSRAVFKIFRYIATSDALVGGISSLDQAVGRITTGDSL